ncbi:putative thymidine phosphorylase [Methanocorpusculaceae archaeon Sp1]|nr:putative thymidine phosphorylase [Methanocorpusculaceae archaeon Sp1]
MILSSSTVDIVSVYAVLHADDARHIGVREGDRVTIINNAKGTSVRAAVSLTENVTTPGTIIITAGANEKLQTNKGDPVEIRVASRPASIEFIRKKMDGGKLTREETAQIVEDMTANVLSPSEITAYITAAYINNLDMDEIEYLTREMVASGDRLSFNTRPIVDKHSIGGVPGNKITLLVVPVIAAAGLLIPKTSSRAITGAGGTADLMEALAPVTFTIQEIQQMTLKAGGVIVWGGATNIAPADDLIITYEYPLKIDARGQMLASIMAKKMAVGSDTCVIDIPVGPGTKVPNENEGRLLANDLIELGRRLGVRVECAITYGGAPVGRNIGVNLEVTEALRILEGMPGPTSLMQKSAALAGMALEMTGKTAYGFGTEAAMDLIKSGKALQKMQEMIEIQGGDPKIKSSDLALGSNVFDVPAPNDGYVIAVKNRELINVARTAGSPADHGAGLHLHKKPGESVRKGEPILTIYADRGWRLQRAIEEARVSMPVVVEGMLLDRVPPIRRVA